MCQIHVPFCFRPPRVPLRSVPERKVLGIDDPSVLCLTPRLPSRGLSGSFFFPPTTTPTPLQSGTPPLGRPPT